MIDEMKQRMQRRNSILSGKQDRSQQRKSRVSVRESTYDAQDELSDISVRTTASRSHSWSGTGDWGPERTRRRVAHVRHSLCFLCVCLACSGLGVRRRRLPSNREA